LKFDFNVGDYLKSKTGARAGGRAKRAARIVRYGGNPRPFRRKAARLRAAGKSNKRASRPAAASQEQRLISIRAAPTRGLPARRSLVALEHQKIAGVELDLRLTNFFLDRILTKGVV
jgi:hypothetical protein